MAYRVRTAALIAIAGLMASTLAEASGDLGRSGPMRFSGGAMCEAGLAARDRGACDPPPVEVSGSAAEVSRTRRERAIALWKLARTEAARVEVGQALAADPNDAESLHLRARMDLTRGRWPQATTDLENAVRVAPENAAVRASLAYLRLTVSALHAAKVEADAAIALAPDDPDALWIRASVRLALGEADRARTDLDRAIVLGEHHEARLLRARLHLDLHRFKEAVTDTTALLQRTPGSPDYLSLRALALVGDGQLAEALDDLGQVIGPPGGPYRVPSQHPSFGKLTLQRASLLVRVGRRDEAARDLDHLLVAGGTRAVLKMQLYLRHNGFPDAPLNGVRTSGLDDLVTMCFLDQACGRGIAAAI